jgi:ribosomal protein S6
MESLGRYEVLILAAPEITQDESKELEKHLEKIVNSKKGEVLSFEKWGKYRLAYPVRKNEYGVYFLMRYQVLKESGILNKEIGTTLSVRFENFIMRGVVTALTEEGSLEYQRPRSLEELPLATDTSLKNSRSSFDHTSDDSDDHSRENRNGISSNNAEQE